MPDSRNPEVSEERQGYVFEYAPAWAEGVSDEELLHELRRRLGYYMHGWQESYASAQRLRNQLSPKEGKG